ncbi:MAG: hypothetical protein A2516_03025 [Alphaproteobacteria bacterium RIFOXYD12_FULL_60_8]|nr:MAG: hypothetical protein A2516_03025 [Alphaproteobacteria bacterium RIFOXYD12_FULL_60_8]
MVLQDVLEILRKERPVLEGYGVAGVAVFGSYARGEQTPDSDIDILVEFTPESHVGLLRFVNLKRRLEHLLGHKIDLATPAALHKGLKDRIMSEAVHA